METNKQFGTKEYYHIQYVVENFDYKKVRKVMTFLNWKWRNAGVPTIDELKEQSIELLLDCYRKYADSAIKISTGGLEASYNGEYFTLKFVLTNWDSEGCY